MTKSRCINFSGDFAFTGIIPGKLSTCIIVTWCHHKPGQPPKNPICLPLSLCVGLNEYLEAKHPHINSCMKQALWSETQIKMSCFSMRSSILLYNTLWEKKTTDLYWRLSYPRDLSSEFEITGETERSCCIAKKISRPTHLYCGCRFIQQTSNTDGVSRRETCKIKKCKMQDGKGSYCWIRVMAPNIAAGIIECKSHQAAT